MGVPPCPKCEGGDASLPRPLLWTVDTPLDSLKYGSDRSLQCCFPTDDSLFLEIFAIKSQNGVVENYVFRLQNFRGEGPPKLDVEIFMPLQGHIMWESFV